MFHFLTSDVLGKKKKKKQREQKKEGRKEAGVR